MAGKALTVAIRVDGARETLAAFGRLPKDANKALRRRTLELSRTLAGRVGAAARADGPQTALMAPTVKAVFDRVPAISAGGDRLVGSRRVPAYNIVFGSEFGARVHHQFRPHLGRGSYWLWKTVQANEVEIAAAWTRVADDIADSFSAGTVA